MFKAVHAWMFRVVVFLLVERQSNPVTISRVGHIDYGVKQNTSQQFKGLHQIYIKILIQSVVLYKGKQTAKHHIRE